NGNFGDGLLVQGAGVALATDIVDSYIGHSARGGISNFAAVVSTQNVELECNTIQLDGENISTWSYEYSDLGDNRCLCGEHISPCQVLSTGSQRLRRSATECRTPQGASHIPAAEKRVGRILIPCAFPLWRSRG